MLSALDWKKILVPFALLILVVGYWELAFCKDINDIDASRLLPLISGNWWEFEGVELSSGAKFRTRLEIGETQTICGIETKPLLFFKDKSIGYWGPGADLNLIWFLVDFRGAGDPSKDFLWALGDKRYQRNQSDFGIMGKFESFFRYISTSPDIPSYVIFSRKLKTGVVGYPAQAYYKTHEERTDCQWVRPSLQEGIANWELEYNLVKVKTPAYRGWTVRTRFKEDFSSRGWLEDWYFVSNIGLVKIETFSQGQKLENNMPVTHRLELVSYFVKSRDGKIRSHSRD